MATTTTTVVTARQLSEHKTRQDLWVAVHGKVFDLTTFAADHPGGIEVLLECAGDDATEPFDYAGHTKAAIAAMMRYKIGDLEGSSHEDVIPIKNLTSAIKPSPRRVITGKSTNGERNTARVLVPIAIAVSGMFLALRYGHNIQQNVREYTIGNLYAEDNNTGMTTAQGFFYGTILTSLLSLVAWVFLYHQWHKTLPHERNVFTYPSVIARRRP